MHKQRRQERKTSKEGRTIGKQTKEWRDRDREERKDKGNKEVCVSRITRWSVQAIRFLLLVNRGFDCPIFRKTFSKICWIYSFRETTNFPKCSQFLYLKFMKFVKYKSIADQHFFWFVNFFILVMSKVKSLVIFPLFSENCFQLFKIFFFFFSFLKKFHHILTESLVHGGIS
jgi:hypothetical protein